MYKEMAMSGEKKMAMNLDRIGKSTETPPFTYTADDVISYALGIGATADELTFIYEKNLKVIPTFAVIPLMPTLFSSFIQEMGLSLFSVFHGEHTITLHHSIPVSGTLHTTTTCDAVYDKGEKGAVVMVSCQTRDHHGTLLFENQAAIFDRSAGNFGGERGPGSSAVDPPAGREPAFCVTEATSPTQAALYRLSGDKNPLHIDPDFAKMAGLDRPILHGLCTFGFAGRAILKSICALDPERLRSFGVRFTDVVYPGDTLTTSGWKMAPGKYLIQTTTQDGRIVLGNGSAVLAKNG
jgi:acyl dehydratase